MTDRAAAYIIPIRVTPVETLIAADRRLAFEVLSAFDAARPGSGSSARVIAEEDGRRLVEFRTEYVAWRGRPSTVVTTEWVTLHPPERIDFTLAQPSGSLALLIDRFTLDDVSGATRFRYESTFGLGRGVIGWVLGNLLVAPWMRRHMHEHTAQVKRLIETRAAHSRQYPRPPTAAGGDGSW